MTTSHSMIDWPRGDERPISQTFAPMRPSMNANTERPSRLHAILCRLYGLFATLIGLALFAFGCVAIAARVTGSTLGGLVDNPAETSILLGLFGVGLGI